MGAFHHGPGVRATTARNGCRAAPGARTSAAVIGRDPATLTSIAGV